METAKLMENDEIRSSSCETNFNRSYGSIAFHERDRVYIGDMMGVVNGEDGLWLLSNSTTGCCLLLE